MLVLPSDHVIRDLLEPSEASRRHCLCWPPANGKLTTFGIVPEHPETGFGYIRRGNEVEGHAAAPMTSPNSSKNRTTERAQILPRIGRLRLE